MARTRHPTKHDPTKSSTAPAITSGTTDAHISDQEQISLRAEDSEQLKEHRPELYENLHRAVCEDTVEQRTEDLEVEVHLLSKRIEQLKAASETAPDSDTPS